MRTSTDSVVQRACRASRSHDSNSETYILIVDDDPDFLDLVRDEIGHIPGARIDTAETPTEGLRRIVDGGYSLIISDWALAESTAPEMLVQADMMIERGPGNKRVPVVFMSGSEKVSQTIVLHTLKNFEPVSFILKRCGPSLIGALAAQILARFHPLKGTAPC